MDHKIEMVTVDALNVTKYGFFCYKSKPKSEGYRRKLDWLNRRFAEGLQIKMVLEEGRSVGFIEYIPAEFAWRAVNAAGYLVIHCLWVVGRAKQKGYGARLLNECLEAARNSHKHGVVMVTSRGNWLADNKLLLKHGFESVDQAPPSFDLMVKKFADAPSPSFPHHWADRLRQYGSGLTIFRSDQCPYLDDATQTALETGQELGLETRVIELKSAQEVRDLAPSVYGVFSLVYNGKLLSYNYELKKDLLKMLDQSTS
jgi:L-amino acid N-acyltransferase YncA